MSVKLTVIASEAKQSQRLGLLRFARNDILWVICRTSYDGWLATDGYEKRMGVADFIRWELPSVLELISCK